MSHTYADRKRTHPAVPLEDNAPAQPAFDALRSGAARLTEEQKGRRVDLPDAMRTKMENAFGADLGAVKLYESQAVADVGSQAIARGPEIAFAPGMLDFTSYGGQALLGHEISHVVSQARGEVTGGGFLSDASLEARADREGAMAAAGQTVAPPVSALSPVTADAAAGPMQAKDKPQIPAGSASGMAPDFGDAEAEMADAAIRRQEEAAGKIPDFGIREGDGSGMTSDFGDARAEMAEAAIRQQEEAAGKIPGLAIGEGEASGMFSDFGDAYAKAAATVVEKQEKIAGITRPAPKLAWGFSSGPDEHTALPGSGIAFVLGQENAADPKHGEAFSNMMSALKANAVAKQNRSRLGPMAYDALEDRALDDAIRGMEEYRKALKREWGNREERKRQIAILDDMLAAATADKARIGAQKSATLEGQSFSGTILGGGINQVYRYDQGGDGAFFKPKKDSSDSTEKKVMERTGIEPASPTHDPRLADREIAFSRLGALLGSSVTLGAKKAVLGKNTPFGETFGDKTFEEKKKKNKPTTGVLMEEAKGKNWIDYDWRFFGLGGGPGGETPKASKVLTYTPLGGGADIGSRLGAAGGMLTEKHANIGNSTVIGSKDGDKGTEGELDMADADFQRQMNELFLLDTLAGHTDRHTGNYMISRDDYDRVNVRAIDNDLTFGKETFFGQRRTALHYGGLPTHMQIDARMASRIGAVDKDTLVRTFSDVLDEEEIQALSERFEYMREYIDDLRQQDESLIVDEWNADTAAREFLLAGGINSWTQEDQAGGPEYSGNNYFQRQMMMLIAAQEDDPDLFYGAMGDQYDPDKKERLLP